MSENHGCTVFISYAHEDRTSMLRLYEKLVAFSYSPWAAEPEREGEENWDGRIKEALDSATLCMLLFGPGGERPWVNDSVLLMIDAWAERSDKGVTLIPVSLPGGPDTLPTDLPDVKCLRRLRQSPGAFVKFDKSFDEDEATLKLLVLLRGVDPDQQSLWVRNDFRYFANRHALNAFNVNWNGLAAEAGSAFVETRTWAPVEHLTSYELASELTWLSLWGDQMKYSLLIEEARGEPVRKRTSRRDAAPINETRPVLKTPHQGFPARPPQVFLSYVRRDREHVGEIYRRLLDAGYRPWMGREDVLAGRRWKSEITKAIRESDFFIACLSEHSVSRRGFLQTEIEKALEVCQEKPPDDNYLIPVRLMKCEVPESLADFRWVDIFEPGGWTQLLKALRLGHGSCGEPEGLTEDTGRPSISKGLLVKSEVAAVNYLQPSQAAELPDSVRVSSRLPMATFPEELERFLRREEPSLCESLDEGTLRFLVTLGTKLEPIVQVTPPTPVPLIIGFENLSLGSLGENFSQICARAPGFDPGVLRLLVTLAAMKTTAALCADAAQKGFGGVWRLLFTINLDPEMLDCAALDGFLERYRCYWEKNVIFEVNEKTIQQYLRRLKELQVDHQMRFCAVNFNDWEPKARKALQDRVEMSKVDYKTFHSAMDVRGDSSGETARRIVEHRIAGKPLVIEGVDNPNYLRFLHEHWSCDKYGQLFGQGDIIEPGRPWDAWTAELRSFGLPGGHFLMGRGEDDSPSSPSLTER